MISKIERLKPIKRTIFTLLVALSVVSFWRGAWGLMDIYLFPNNYELSSWVSILIGLVILYVTHYWYKELI